MILIALIYGAFDYLSNTSTASTEEKNKEQVEKIPFPVITTTNKNFIGNSNLTSNSNVIANSNVTTFSTGNGNISVNSISGPVTNSNNRNKVGNTRNTSIQNQYYRLNPNGSKKAAENTLPNKKATSMNQSQSVSVPQAAERQYEMLPLKPFNINNDPKYRTYLSSITNLRNKGADLSNCRNVQVCVNSYSVWYRQATNLLNEVENFVQRKYGKRTDLTRRFDQLNINPPLGPQEQDRINYCRTMFFLHVEIFGRINVYVDEAFMNS